MRTQPVLETKAWRNNTLFNYNIRPRASRNVGKHCSKFFFWTLFSIIFLSEAKNICFLLIPVKFVVVLRKIKDGSQDGGHVLKRLN